MSENINEQPSGPPYDKPIDEVHVWIGITRDGEEGMLSADFPTPFGIRHMPLISSQLENAKRLEPIAQGIRDKSVSRSIFIEIELRTFKKI